MRPRPRWRSRSRWPALAVGYDYVNQDDFWYDCPGSQGPDVDSGDGSGFSAREVIDVCRTVTERDIPVTVALRRPGDPALLVASARRIQSDSAGRPATTCSPWSPMPGRPCPCVTPK